VSDSISVTSSPFDPDKRRVRLARNSAGALVLRVDDVILTRGRRGHWFIDIVAVIEGKSRHVYVRIGPRLELDALLRAIRASSTTVDNDPQVRH
jgi:hypothetical protein